MKVLVAFFVALPWVVALTVALMVIPTVFRRGVPTPIGAASN